VNVFRDMAFITPVVSATTGAETISAVAASALTSRPAARIVVPSSATGTHPGAVCGNTVATAAADGPKPCRVSRFASIARARDSRLATVPSGMPSSRAASRPARPSRSHSTTTARYFSGSRASS
jgi:hypothetical protein